MVKSNAVNQTISSREFSDEGVNIKKNEKKLPGSFKSDLEGYRMTAAWARKQMSQYGGKIRQCIALAKQTFKTNFLLGI